MPGLYTNLIRPILFRRDPEAAHHGAAFWLARLHGQPWLCRIGARINQRVPGGDPIELFGVKFANMVGMAAGMDKEASFWRAAAALGFGHVEVGTITALAQPGNDKPRLFRYPEERAIINRMGFNNEGCEAIARRLKRDHADRKGKGIVLGINIGKSKVTPLEEAPADYVKSFTTLADYADYFTINVSSPNTPGLRTLQGADQLNELLGAVQEANRGRAAAKGVPMLPVLLKIAPDLTFPQIDDALAVIRRQGLAGIVATNTTLARPGFFASVDQAGGLSGRPVHQRSVDVVRYISQATKGRLPIIGVGGIEDEATAAEMVDAGAHLLQVYTGFIYEGPSLPKRIARALGPQHKGVFHGL